MKKKGLLFVFMLILGMLLCSCSGDSPDKMTGVKLPSGEKLELYMSRDKVEELMSSYDYEVMLKKYNYGLSHWDIQTACYPISLFRTIPKRSF